MTNETDLNTPVGIDPTRASVARVYDYFLGGKDNFEVDRKAAGEIAATRPDVVEIAKENRLFQNRVVRFIANQTNVTQFLDCGSGLPTAENVHQVAQRFNPEARIVYVDNDPVVIAHGRALLDDNNRTRFIDGDIFSPATILNDPVVTGHLDWTEPIALLQLFTLHHHKGDRGAPAEVMRAYIDALPSGSFVAISHLLDPENDDSEPAKQMADTAARGSLGGATWRTRAEIEELFHSMELIPPGIVEMANWWPDGPRTKELTVAHRITACGVARKP